MVFFNYLNKAEIGTSFVCLVQSTTSSLLHKSNTMYLSKEATNKDKNLKTQLSLSTETGDEKSADTEKIWDKPGFFGDQVADFTNNKVNFQKNTLVYANQGDLAVYLDYVILGQLIPAMNSPENIDEYESLANEVKMVILLYNAYSGEFLGLEKRLAFILVRGDQMRHFFSNGYDQSKSTKLYSTSKKPLPNIFSGTCFKNDQDFSVEHRSRQENPTLFFYLTSSIERSYVINQLREYVSLHPIDCPFEAFKQYSKNEEDFVPSDVESRHLEKCETANVKPYEDFSRTPLRFLTPISSEMRTTS